VRRPFGSASNLTEFDDDEVEDEADDDVEDDDDVESRMTDPGLLGLDTAWWLAWVWPCPTGGAGRLPDPTSQIPLRLRC
jgi:hypothetical protein